MYEYAKKKRIGCSIGDFNYNDQSNLKSAEFRKASLEQCECT